MKFKTVRMRIIKNFEDEIDVLFLLIKNLYKNMINSLQFAEGLGYNKAKALI